MTKHFVDLSNQLICEIHKLVSNIEFYDDCDFNFVETYSEVPNLTLKQKLQNKESWYDQMYEYYNKICKLIESEDMFKQLFVNFQMDMVEYFQKWGVKKERIGVKMDECLYQIKEMEKEVKGYVFDSEYEILNYEKYAIDTEKWIEKRMENEKLKDEELTQTVLNNDIKRRHEIVKEFFSETEMKVIENEIERYVDSILFDSNINNWSKGYCKFYSTIDNHSNVIFLIETENDEKFGCFIEKPIHHQGKHFSDKNSFIFKLDNGSIQKYPITEYKYALKVFNNNDDDLFVVGKSDILVKKKDKKDKCYCIQRSFDYNGKENVLLERRGTFDVKNIYVIGTMSEKDMEQHLINEKKRTAEEIKISEREEWKRRQEEEKKIEYEKQLEKQKKKLLLHRKNLLEKMIQENKKEIKQLEDWTSLQCQNILFDSTVDKWSSNDSVFFDQIIGKKQLIFLIEDTEGNRFGYYLNTEILGKYHQEIETDLKSFLFTLKSGRNDTFQKPMKFKIKDTKKATNYFFINQHDLLIKLGDIKIAKENMKTKSKIIQNSNSFEYNGIEHIISQSVTDTNGKQSFIPNQIIVIQMGMSQEQIERERKKLEEMNDKRQNNFKEYKEEYISEIKQLEEWTSMTCADLLFDSEIDNWEKYTSNLNERIIGKKQLVFLIEENSGERFGYYLHRDIVEKYTQKTPTYSQTFHFNLHSENNRLEQPIQFEIKHLIYGGYTLYETYEEKLIELGDIILMKNNTTQSICSPQRYGYFDYHGIDNALCGQTISPSGEILFTPQRILVFEMRTEEDEKEIKRLEFEQMRQQNISHWKYLEYWTDSKCHEILFDSDQDNWDIETSVFNEKIIGKSKLVFLIEDEDSEQFGYYLNTEIVEKYHKNNETNNESFQFNLISNGRLKEPMKFEIVDEKNGGYCLFKEKDDELIKLGDIRLYKQSKKNESWSDQFDDYFDYYGIKNALCGKEPNPKRILIIQMK